MRFGWLMAVIAACAAMPAQAAQTIQLQFSGIGSVQDDLNGTKGTGFLFTVTYNPDAPGSFSNDPQFPYFLTVFSGAASTTVNYTADSPRMGLSFFQLDASYLPSYQIGSASGSFSFQNASIILPVIGAGRIISLLTVSAVAPTESGYSYRLIAVPEPATWLLMLAGFGVLGATMRRKVIRDAPRKIPTAH